jgi:hypothetical protein
MKDRCVIITTINCKTEAVQKHIDNKNYDLHEMRITFNS